MDVPASGDSVTSRLPVPEAALPSRWLFLATALLPVVCVNLNQALSVAGGYIPACYPYWEGCTSISSTGRHGWSYGLFKAMMLPHSVLLVLLWRRLHGWLSAGERLAGRRIRRTVLVAGLLGAAFLVLYTVFLGSSGDIYRLMRRYGVFVFFLGTFIAQIVATRRLAKLRLPGVAVAVRAQVAMLLLMGVLAVAEVPLGKFGLADNVAENIIEWNFSLLMQCWFVTWLFVAPTQHYSPQPR